MKKKLIRGLIALAIVIGGGAAFTMTSSDVQACKKCSTKNSDRKCGECKSTRLFAKTSWTASNGKIRTSWKCEDCGHNFITEMRNGKEVVLTEKEIANE